MARGVVVGPGGRALTTFVGVLYAAQMRHSEGDAYRFACSSEALAVLGRVYSAMQQGDFPLDLDEEDFARVVFQMDFPDSLGKRLLPFGRGKRDRNLPELELGIAPIAPGKAGPPPGAPGWSALLEASLLVLLAELPSIKPPAAPIPSDASLAGFVDSMAASARAGAHLAPTVVFWLPGPPAPTVAKDNTETPAIPPPADARARAGLAGPLLGAALPATSAALARVARGGAPPVFFAWVRTETKAKALRVARRQQFGAGGVEPDYPYDELGALIDHLGRLAA